jgi:hypothetical protein
VLQVDIYTPLAEQLPRLWQLWEMVLTCQPLLVVAPTPGDASGCVAALASLLAPLPYAADFRWPLGLLLGWAVAAGAAGAVLLVLCPWGPAA